MSTRILTLGRFAILVDGVERDSFLAQPMRSAVALYLALERETTREATMAVFWPERSPEAARHALSQTLHKLRRDLGEDFIQTRGERLRVATLVEVDAERFETAAERREWATAFDLYHGPFLEGWHLADVAGFEDWVDRRRAHLGRLFREAVQGHIVDRLSASDPESAIAAARRWAGMEPLETEPVHTLLELLARTGQTAEAIREYEEYARRAAAEELEPAPEIAALVHDIRSQPVSLRRPLPTGTARPRFLPTGRVGRRTRWIVGLTVAVAATVLVLTSRPSSRAPERLSSPDRILVLPLQNLSGDPALDRLGTMGADWIVDGLSRVGVVRVVPLMDVLRAVGPEGGGRTAAGKDEWARELAAGVLAGTVVIGSYGRDGDRLLFRAQVVSVEDGTLLGTVEPVYGTVDAPLPAIDELRQGVMGIVAVRFDPRWSERHAGLDSGIPPPRYDAYRAYADGLETFLRLDYENAIPLLLRAAELDSSFTRPLLLAATGFRALGDYAHAESLVAYLSARAEHLTPYESGALDWQRAKLRADVDALLRGGVEVTEQFPGTAGHFVAAVDALEANHLRLALRYFEGLDPERGWSRDYFPLWDGMASAHHALGDYEAELRVTRQARARLPAHLCGLRSQVRPLAALGRLADLEEVLTHSLEFAPQIDCSPGDVMLTAALELRAHGRTGAARQVTTRVIAWYRSRPGGEASGARHRAALARALYLAGRFEEAASLLASLAAEFPENVDYMGQLGVVAARQGGAAAAARDDAMLADLAGPYLYGAHTAWRARIAATLGERERAVMLLRDAFSQGLPWSVELHADPDLESLVDYPPFQRLLEPKG